MDQDLNENRKKKLELIEYNIKAIDDKLVRLYANRKALNKKAKQIKRQIAQEITKKDTGFKWDEMREILI